MNSGSQSLDGLLLKYTSKKERDILEGYAGAGLLAGLGGGLAGGVGDGSLARPAGPR